MAQATKLRTKCPECGSSDFILDDEMGELVCKACGLVVGEKAMSEGPEWRAFTREEKESRARVGPPAEYSHYDKGLYTSIEVTRDAFGRPLSPEVRRQMWRLKRWNVRSKMHASHDRNLMQAMNELELLSEKLHIPPHVKETAALIYRKALNEDLVRGRSIPAIVAASLHAACRITKTPKTLREIVEATTRSEKEVSRCYRIILRSLKMKMPIDSPLDYVLKIAEKAGVSGEVQGLAVKILREAKVNRAVAGKDPTGLAAAAVYLASEFKGEKITQKKIAEAAEVTEVTIRKRKGELVKKVNLAAL